MKRSLVMLILSTFLINSFAQTVKLEKGEVAPNDGFLITQEVAEEAAKNKLRVIKLEDLKLAQEDLLNFHKADAKTQRKKLSEAKFDSYMNVLGAFVLGVLVTGFAAKMNQKIGDL